MSVFPDERWNGTYNAKRQNLCSEGFGAFVSLSIIEDYECRHLLD